MAENEVHDEIGVKKLADVLGVGERWVQQLENQGVLKKSGHGRYLLAESVQAYIKFKVESELSRAIPEESNPGERVKAERARKLTLENDEKERRIVQMPAAIAALDAIVGPLKADLAGVPARVTDDVSERRRIENAIDAVLGGLADRFKQASRALREGVDPLSTGDED